jgi:hypothetical protein
MAQSIPSILSFIVSSATSVFNTVTNELSAVGFNSQLNISSATSSISTTTGALVVTGGVGIGKNLYVGGAFTSTGVIVGNSGATFNGVVSIPSSYLSVGNSGLYTTRLVVGNSSPNGGLLVNNSVNTGIDIGAATIGGITDTGTNTATVYFNIFRESSINSATAISTFSNLATVYIKNSPQINTSSVTVLNSWGLYSGGAVGIFNTTQTTGTTTGALVVAGGVGIGGNLYIGGVASATNFYINGSPVVTAATAGGVSTVNTSAGAITISAGTDTVVSTNSSTITIYNTSTLQTVTGRGATTNNAISINNNTSSTGTNSGALQVIGGVGIGGNLYVGNTLTVLSTLSSTSSVSQNALYVAGGLGVGSSLYVTGPAVFNNNVTFSGTTTYVLSTNTVYTDNIIELHYASTWTVNDNKDIGLRFHYYDTADRNAFFGRDNITGYLEWLVNSSPDNTNNVTGTNGTFRLGSIILTDTTASNTTATGALTVVGGVGVGGNIYVGGVITATNVYVNGYAVSTSTFNTGTLVAQAVSATSLVSGTWTFTVSSTGSVTLNGTPFVSGNVTAASGTGTTTTFVISNITSSTGTNSGALQVIGGAGIVGNLNVGGTITGGGVRTTTTSTAPSNPIVGDIWYYTASDVIYRYTNDGSNNVWLDITGPTYSLTTNTSLVIGVAQQGNTQTVATSVGYLGLPQNPQTGTYTLTYLDQGGHVYLTGSTATVLIPANTVTSFAIGTTVAVIAGPVTTGTIRIQSDSLYLAGAGSTGTRTLAPYGMATIVKVTTNTWFVSGAGLT